MTSVTAWVVRASNLNELVMFQLTPLLLRPHYRVVGVWSSVQNIEHHLPIAIGQWVSVRTLVRGSWATVFITVDGTEHRIFQEQMVGNLPATTLSFAITNVQTGEQQTINQMVNPSYSAGSFGFRLSGIENAQFRNVEAFRLR